MSCKVDIDVRNRVGNILKGQQLKMTTGEAYLAVHVTSKFFCNAITHPPPLNRDICDIDCTSLKTIKNSEKFSYVAIEWRVGPLKDHRYSYRFVENFIRDAPFLPEIQWSK